MHVTIDGSGTVLDVDSGAPRLEFGSRFTMRLTQLGQTYTSVSRVAEYETDRVLTRGKLRRAVRTPGGERTTLALPPGGTA